MVASGRTLMKGMMYLLGEREHKLDVVCRRCPQKVRSSAVRGCLDV